MTDLEQKKSKEKTPDPKKVRKKVKVKPIRRNKLAIFIILSAAALYIGNILIDNPYTHKFVNFYLNEKFLDKLPIGAEYQSMRVQLLPPSINLFGFKMWTKDSSGTRGQELLSTNQASLSISPWSLFLAKPQIGDFELHGLKASWPPPSNVLKALEEFASSNSKPKTSAVDRVSWPPTDTPPISSISIFDGQILLAMPGLSLNTDQDPKEITSVELSGFEAQVDFRSWKDIFLGVKAAKANLYDRGSSYIEDAEIELRGRFKLQEFESNVFTITSKRLNSRGNFKTNIRTSKIINRNYIDSIDITIASDATANFSLLGSFLDIGGCTGDVSAKTTTKIEIPLRKDLKASLLVTGTGQSAGASLSGFNLYDSEADFTIDLDGMKFDEVRLKSKDSQFGKAKGRIGFNSKIDFDFSGKPKNLPFDMLLGVFNVPFNVVNFGLTSENLSIKGLGKPFSMNVAATSILDDFDTPATPYSHDLIPDSPVCKVNLNMDINKAGIKFEKNDGGCKRRTDHSYDGLPLNIFGHTAFNNKSGMNLNIESTNYKTLAPLSFFSQLDLTGTGSLKAIIHGPYDNIKVELDMRGGPTSIAEIPLRSVDFLGQVNSQEFLWSQVLAKTESGGQLASKGKISLNPSLDLDTDLNATQIDHVTMNKIFKKLIDKKSTLELVIDSMHSKIKGPLLNPLEYRGDVQLEASTIKDNDNMYASKFKGLIESYTEGYRMKNGTVQHGTLISLVDAKIIRRSKSNLVDQQSADIDKNEPSGSAEDQVNISIRSLPADSPTNQLEFFPFIAPLAAKAGVAGTVSGSTKLSGNFKKLIGVSKLKLENVTILGSKVPAVVGSLVIDGSKMEIMADQGGNALKGRLNFDFLEKGIPYSWFLATKNFDLRPFLPKVFSSDPRNFAYVTATWSLKGLFQDWWKSTGSLDIKNFESKIHTKKEYSKPPFEIKSRDLVQVKMRPDGWQTVDGKSLTLESIHGALQLGLQNSKPPEQLGISINGKLSLEILRTIIPKIEVATGQVQFNGGLFGPAQDPKINLSFSDTKISAETASTWQPVSIGTAEFRPPIKDMKIEATLTSDEIQISSLKGNKGTGKISAEGVISLNRSNGKLTDLAINLDEASFLYPFPIVKNFDSILDGNLRITGSKFPLLAGGQIIVKRARSNREIDIRNAIVESLRSSSLGSSGPESLDPSINFDINILANDSISFNSRTAQAVLSSDLKLAGTEISPEITGVVELKKGKFLYKRDFVIQRGLVNFDDPVKPDPSLDISAQSEVSGYKVNITISGKASEPIVDFSIDPPTRPDGSPITKLEIIQLLNRGSLPEQSLAVALSNVGEGDNGESTAATEALNLLAGQVEDTVQRVFDLSGQNIIRQVYIDTYVSDEKPIARFNLPLSLTDDLDLILKVDQSTVQITSELALHDSISLLGGVESNSEKKNGTANRQGGPADTGVDVKFKFAFP